MMNLPKPFKRACRIVMTVMLSLGVIAPAATASTTATSNCLYLTGSATEGALNIYMNEPVEMAFSITPEGSFTTSTKRDPADISLVLDVSGSMQYSNEDGRWTPTRMDSLKAASKDLLDKLAAVNLKDRVGIIKFATSARKLSDLSTNYSYLKSQVDQLYPDGATNIDHGLTLAYSMLLSGSAGKKIVILVTDGYANRYITDTGKIKDDSMDKARQEAIDSAARLAASGVVVYPVALGKAGSSDVDHTLLENIAAATGGKKYDASSTEDLKSVFDAITQQIQQDGSLTSIVIRQPLPPGFILADGNPEGVSIEDGQLVIRAADIAYPFAANPGQTITVKLKQTNFSGEYDFHDATMAYKDACSVEQTGTIPVNVSVSVIGSITDIYGNRYVGSGTGEVTRYKLGDLNNPQWRIKAVDSPVTSISFVDPANTVVKVGYLNGEERIWDLKPTAPDATITDAGGAVIESGDADWHRGPAAVAAANAQNKLPAETEYLNDDFSTNYISGYGYRVKQPDGTWGAWFAVSALNNISESRKNLEMQTEALTAAISGDPNNLIGGDTTNRSVSLDGTPPEAPAVAASFLPSYKQYRYEVTNIIDTHSGVLTDGFGNKLFKLSMSGADTVKTETDNVFTASDADITAGHVAIAVTDKVGNTKLKTVTEKPIDGSGPDIIFKPNAVANPSTDPVLEVKAQENASYVYQMHVYVDNAEVPITQSSPLKTVTHSFNLSSVIPDNPGLSDPLSPRYGWHQLKVQAENVAGERSEESFVFKVNPGPYGELTASTANVSNEPVTVSLSQLRLTPVPQKVIDGTTYSAVKVTDMYYDIVSSPLADPGAHTFTKKLGAKQFKVSTEGTNYVYVMLQDADGNKFVTAPAVVKINYNQKKY